MVGWSAPRASAQEIRLRAGQAWPDQSLLGNPQGFGIDVGRSFDRVGVRLGVEVYGDDFASFGSTCVGLIPPDEECAPEQRDDESYTRALTFQTPIRALSLGRAELSLVPGVRVSWIGNEQTGRTTGRTLDADEVMFGVDLGAEVSLKPVADWPLGVQVGGSVGLMNAFRNDVILDGYDPFVDSFAVQRLHFGMSVAR